MALDQQQVDEFKKKLEEQKIKLEHDLGGVTVQSDKNSSDYKAVFPNYGDEEEDNALEVSTFDHNLAVERNLEQELKEVNWALKRIEQGTYGKCSNCDKEISIERLQARATAEKCIECAK